MKKMFKLVHVICRFKKMILALFCNEKFSNCCCSVNFRLMVTEQKAYGQKARGLIVYGQKAQWTKKLTYQILKDNSIHHNVMNC